MLDEEGRMLARGAVVGERGGGRNTGAQKEKEKKFEGTKLGSAGVLEERE